MNLDGVLFCPDLLCLILSHLHRRQACVAACACTVWRDALARMTSQDRWPFRPRVLVGCSRSSQVVDISSLLPGQRLPATLPRTDPPPALVQGKKKKQSEPWWLTCIAISPYGRRALHVCQYNVMGIEQYATATLQRQGILVHDIMLAEPEGVTFAHGHMYVQSNWGQLVRCTLEGQVLDRMYVGGELVTWAVAAGPDGNLYIAADLQYRTRWYTDVPELTTGCVMKATLQSDGSFQAPATLYSRVTMKRPCGLRWGPVCGSLFVTCLDPAILRLAGPSHPQPGSLLARISLDCCPGLVPWDVVLLKGATLVVTMHKRRTLRVPKPESMGAGIRSAAGTSSFSAKGGKAKGPADQGTSSASAIKAGGTAVCVAGVGNSSGAVLDRLAEPAGGPAGSSVDAAGVATGVMHQQHAVPVDVSSPPQLGLQQVPQQLVQSHPSPPQQLQQLQQQQQHQPHQPGQPQGLPLPPAPTRSSARIRSQGYQQHSAEHAPVDLGSSSHHSPGPSARTTKRPAAHLASPVGQDSHPSIAAAGCSTGGPSSRAVTAEGDWLDPDNSYLVIIPDLGQGHARVVPLPLWMDHANMMCVDD